jgi:hypothetical protein
MSLANDDRLTIAYVTGHVVAVNPTEENWSEAKRNFRYLKGTMESAMTYDVYYADDEANKQSAPECVITLNNSHLLDVCTEDSIILNHIGQNAMHCRMKVKWAR